MADTLTATESDNTSSTELAAEQNADSVALEPGAELPGSGPQRLTSFLHDVREETKKVVTPSRDEVRQTTIVVLATVFLFAAYFELVDLVLGKGIDKLLLSLTRH